MGLFLSYCRGFWLALLSLMIVGVALEESASAPSIIVPVWEVPTSGSEPRDIASDTHLLPPFYASLESSNELAKIMDSFFNETSGKFNNTAFYEYMLSRFNESCF
jgi:hypothetical protein